MELNAKSYLGKNWSNQLKGFAIFLVMIGHLGLVWFSAAWGTSIFLLVSGFGLTQSFLRSGLSDYFNKRISKVLFPYAFITLLWILIDTFLYKIKNPKSVIALSLVGINLKCSFDLSMWYVTFILAWYVVFYFTFRLVKNNVVRMIILFIFSIVCSKYSIIFPTELGVSRYVPEFPIGVLLGLSYKRILNIKINKVLTIQSIISATFFILYYYLYKNTPTPETELLQCLFYVLAIVSFFTTLSIYSVRLKLLEFIGSISFEIYLFEYVFIEKYKFIFKLQIDPWLRLAVYFSFVICLALLYKYLQNALKYLLNKRVKIFSQ